MSIVRQVYAATTHSWPTRAHPRSKYCYSKGRRRPFGKQRPSVQPVPTQAHLNKIQAGVDVMLHNENGQMAVGLLDAVVQHPNEDVRIVLELYHELLVFLHHLTTIKVSGRYLCGSRPDTVKYSAQLSIRLLH